MQSYNFFYIKAIYNNPEELLSLKKKLYKYKIIFKIMRKNDLSRLGIKQYLNTYFLYFENKLQKKELNEILSILKKVDSLQVLGFVEKNNLLLQESDITKQENLLFLMKFLIAFLVNVTGGLFLYKSLYILKKK